MDDIEIDGQKVRFLGDVQRLQMQPGDVAVLSVDDHVSDDMAKRLKEYWNSAFPGVRLLVLDKGMRIGLLNNNTESEDTRL